MDWSCLKVSNIAFYGFNSRGKIHKFKFISPLPLFIHFRIHPNKIQFWTQFPFSNYSILSLPLSSLCYFDRTGKMFGILVPSHEKKCALKQESHLLELLITWKRSQLSSVFKKIRPTPLKNFSAKNFRRKITSKHKSDQNFRSRDLILLWVITA